MLDRNLTKALLPTVFHLLTIIVGNPVIHIHNVIGLYIAILKQGNDRCQLKG